MKRRGVFLREREKKVLEIHRLDLGYKDFVNACRYWGLG